MLYDMVIVHIVHVHVHVMGLISSHNACKTSEISTNLIDK